MARAASVLSWFLNEVVGAIPFVGMRMWFYARAGIKFEDRRHTTIMMHTELMAPRGISIGRGTILGREVVIDGRAPLTIGQNANIGSRTQIYTGTHNVHDNDFVAEFHPVTIEDHVWLALGVTVLPGVTIGRGAVVAAGAVVTRDLPGGKLYAGVPAREIGPRDCDLTYQLGYRPNGI